MNKIFFSVLFFLVISVNLNAAGDIFTVYGYVIKASKVLPISVTTIDSKNIIKEYFGGGASYNSIRFEYNPYYDGGRIAINYDFFRSKKIFTPMQINPYLGASYIFNTKRVSVGGKQKLDGYAATLGVSFILYNIVSPYIEIAIPTEIFYFGVRLHIPISIENRK